MHLYYFIHLTGRDSGNSGIQRVVRNLGTALQSIPSITLLPVRWNQELQAVVHAEEPFRERIKLFNGPRFNASESDGLPIHLDKIKNAQLLMPEVPLFQSPDPRYPFVHLPFVIGYLHSHNIKITNIFHDIMPLSHFGEEFSEYPQSLKFFIYANALSNVDNVISVSKYSEQCLTSWFGRCGIPYSSKRILQYILLPEEMIGVECRKFIGTNLSNGGTIEFCMWGSLYPHKNQVAVLEAFTSLCELRLDLNLKLHVFGNINNQVVAKVQRLVRFSNGNIIYHGFVDDKKMADIIRRCRATLFVSLAEGYGLPLAESLWLGKPCLTSNIPPMTEIAAGGGCLLVDPENIKDIITGLERLAIDDNLIAKLNAEIAVRRYRTWSDYANEIVDAIRNCKDCQEDMQYTYLPTRRLSDFVETLAISPTDLSIHSVFKDSAFPILRNGRIFFDSEDYIWCEENVISYGPYISLKKGIYECFIIGELKGDVILRATAEYGSVVFGEAIISDLSTRFRFNVSKSIDKFEILIIRSNETKTLRVDMIELDRYST
ncbi:glycosyltransferase family 1 protein [Komagataeibacter melaceti]|uniref:Glycosyltransferase family 1 protein n=1 Tax=Komagataeibacter melaceti TaxID=2766577 RepID=A0A371YX28_9PROT|nr:glycosyltransferase [Komagataeibacter melaceti]RFD18764.1 glycosyltransferase family 1 protein [Komagataeibacter melaceti]